MNPLSDQEFGRLIVNAPIGICVLDADTLVAEIANDSFIAVAGKRRDEIVGQFYWDAFAEARAYYEPALAGVVRDGKPFYANEVQLELIRHGRFESVYVTFVYVPLKDNKGKVQKVAVWVLENTLQVTQRREIEEAQQKAELAINSARLGFYDYTYSTDSLISNERFKEMFGVTNDTDHQAYLQMLHPDDRDIRDKAHTLALQTGTIFYEVRFLRPDSSYYWIRVNGDIMYDSAHQPQKIVGVCQDITESVMAQKEVEASEQVLRNMILQAPVAMCILTGSEHVVLVANTKMYEIWGKGAAELLGRPIFVGLSEAKNQGFEALLDSVYNTGEKFVANEHELVLPHNGVIEKSYVNFTYDALRGADGKISGVLAVAVDVTEQVRSRQKIEELVEQRTIALTEANNDLKKKNEELAQFAYIASHDLQEPLRKISTFTGMLESYIEAGDKEKAKTYTDRIMKASTRMSSLIKGILTYSAVENDHEIYEDVDLNEVLNSTLEDFDLAIEKSGANIEAWDLPVVTAIPLQMAQLFSNMIGNTLKFVRNGTAPLLKITCISATASEIASQNLDTAISYHKIQFADNGIGISPQFTKRIFSIFQRLHQKSEFEGTGIGLAMCKKIAENHHGQINAEGSSEAGAVFNLYLPVITK